MCKKVLHSLLDNFPSGGSIKFNLTLTLSHTLKSRQQHFQLKCSVGVKALLTFCLAGHGNYAESRI